MGSYDRKLSLIEILLEIGDYNNIKPYDLSNVSKNGAAFVTDEGWNCTIEIEQITVEQLKQDTNIPPVFYQVYDRSKEKNKDIFNVGYKVEDNEKQYEKSDLTSLNKILATVLEYMKRFMDEYDPFALVIIATPSQHEVEKDKNVKLGLYTNIVRNSIFNKYRSSSFTKDERKGIVLYKKK